MSQQSNREEISVRYLLGTLSEKEREQLEDLYFSDQKEFEKIEIAEDEVIDRYVRRQLSLVEKRNFETVLDSSPRLAQRVKLARLFTTRVDAEAQSQVAEHSVEVTAVVHKKAEKQSWWNRLFGTTATPIHAFRVATASAMVIFLLITAALCAAWLNSRKASQQLAADKARIETQIQGLEEQIAAKRADTDKLDAELRKKQEELNAKERELEELRAAQQRNNSNPTLGNLAPLILSAGATRSGDRPGMSEVVVGPNTSAVSITLNLTPSEFQTYNVSIVLDERVVHREGSLRPKKGTLHFNVPARKLKPADYVIHLVSAKSNDPVAEYFFKVVAPK